MVRRVCDKKIMLLDGRTIPAGAPFEVSEEEATGLLEAGYPIHEEKGKGKKSEAAAADDADAEEKDAVVSRLKRPGPSEYKVGSPDEAKTPNGRRGEK